MSGRSKLSTAGDEWGSGRKRGEDAELDITPMIDVTFLLLIFFMVTSTMQGKPDLDVPPVKHGVGVDSGSVAVITISAPKSESDDPQILLDGQQRTLEDVKGFVDDNIREGSDHIVIKADREVPHGFVQQVTRVVTEFEGVTFSIGVRDHD